MQLVVANTHNTAVLKLKSDETMSFSQTLRMCKAVKTVRRLLLLCNDGF